MKNLKALRQEREDLKAKARAILAKAKDESRDLTEAEETELDALEAAVAEKEQEVQALEIALDRERTFAPAASPLEIPGAGRVQIMDRSEDPALTFGFHHLADFATTVHRTLTPGAGFVDPRLEAALAAWDDLMKAQPANYHQESGTEEGYMVPPAFAERIWEVVVQELDLLGMTDDEPTSSNAVQLLKDETTPWGSAGVQAMWAAEAEKLTASKLDTKSITVRLQKLFAFVLATEELLQDAPRMNDRLTRKAGQAISWVASDAIAFGDGVGKPLGFQNSPALVVQAKEAGQAAKTIVVQNIAKMFSRLLPASMARARWLINSDALPQLFELKIGDTPVWIPPREGLVGAPAGFLMGRPIMPTEHAETLGTQGDITLADMMGYYTTRKAAGVQFASSMHLFFDFQVMAFRWTFRINGQPYLSAPIGPKRGTATKSHFITLATRA